MAKTISATAVAAAASSKGKTGRKTGRKTGSRASGAQTHLKSLALNYGTVAGTAALASGLVAYRVKRKEQTSVFGVNGRLIAGALGLGLNYWKPNEKWAHYAKLVGLGSLISWASDWGEDQGAAMGLRSKGVPEEVIQKAKEDGAMEPAGGGAIIGAVGLLGGKRALERRERRLEKKVAKIEAKQALRSDTARRGKPANSQMVRVPAFAVKPEYASRYGI